MKITIDTAPQGKFRQHAYAACLWALLIVGLFVVRHVLLPIVLAVTIAYVLDPLVSKMNRLRIGDRKLPRLVALALVYLFVASLIYLLSYFFMPQIYREMIKFNQEIIGFIQGFDNDKVTVISHQVAQWVERYHLPIEVVLPGSEALASKSPLLTLNVAELIQTAIRDGLMLIKSQTAHFVTHFHHVVKNIFERLFEIFLILVVTAFILADTKRIKNFFFRLVPSQEHGAFNEILQRIDRGLAGVVRGQLFICLLNGILTLVGLLLLKVKFSLLLATIAAVLSIIPIFGSIISTIPIVFVAASSDAWTGLWAFLWIVGIHALEANLLNPKILGNAAKIHPILITLALLAGRHFYGMIGLLLAVPVASILFTLYMIVVDKMNKMPEAVAKEG